METAPKGEGQEKRKLPPHFQTGVGKQPLCGWARPLLFLARCSPWQPSFQTRGTEHISIWCRGAKEAQGEWDWEWGTSHSSLDRARPRPGFDSGLQSFPMACIYCTSPSFYGIGTHGVFMGVKGRKVPVWNLACRAAQAVWAHRRQRGLEGGPGAHIVPHCRDSQTCSKRELYPWVQRDMKCF